MTDTTGPHFVLGGERHGTSPYNQGTFGLYWSSLAYTDAATAYYLRLNDSVSTVYPASNSYKRFGFSLRCLAQNQTKNKKPSRLNKKQNKKNRKKVVPKSFRLPTGGPSGEYQTLYNNYNSWTAMTDPSGPQFVLGGRTDPGSSPLYQGRDGNYWSSSAYTSATYAYRLLLSSTDSSVLPARYSPKLLGFSLRCLAQ